MTFCIDETGNSGDVVIRPDTKPFGGQPVFALAAVGASSGAPDLGDTIHRLAKVHRVDGTETEVKGGRIAKTRPAFVLGLVQHLIAHGHPIVVELVDKQYHLAVQIAQHFLLGVPILSGGHDPHSIETWALSNRLAEVVYDHADLGLYETYSTAALSRSPEDLHRFLIAFALRIDSAFAAAQAAGSPDTSALVEAGKYGIGATTAFNQFYGETSLTDEKVVEDFLPRPDTDNGGNRLVMHPHATSFLNLLGRMNKVATDLGSPDLALVHDEQLQLEPVVRGHYEALTSGAFSFLDGRLSGSGVPYEGNVLYTFSDDHDLRFEDSRGDPGVQVADVVAAACRVYYQLSTSPKTNVPEDLGEAARLLAGLSDDGNSQGVNVVAPYGPARSTFARSWPPVPPWSLVPPPRFGG